MGVVLCVAAVVLLIWVRLLFGVGLLVCCRCGCGWLLLIVLFSVLVVRIYSYLLFTVSDALLRDLVDFVYVCDWYC